MFLPHRVRCCKCGADTRQNTWSVSVTRTVDGVEQCSGGDLCAACVASFPDDDARIAFILAHAPTPPLLTRQRRRSPE